MQIVLIGLGAGAAAALLFASVASGTLLSISAVLSGAAADPDRGTRLEPLGGTACGRCRRASAWLRIRRRCSFSPFLPASGVRRGGSAISRCWRGRRQRAAAAGSNGIHRDAWCSGPPFSPRYGAVAIPNFGSDAETFRSALQEALMTSAARGNRRRRCRLGARRQKSRPLRRFPRDRGAAGRARCVATSPACSICGSPPAW